MWIQFLLTPQAVARPFIDFQSRVHAEDVGLFSDASRAEKGKGFGCYFRETGEWTYQVWEPNFIEQYDPSIQFLELYAQVVSIRLWGKHFRNRRIEVNCDNESVVTMINHSTSKCPRCMILIRLLTKHSMTENLRVFAKHLGTKQNGVADSLSCNDLKRFWELVPANETKLMPEKLPSDMWPIPTAWFQAG